jgi:hypothetical protein
MTTIQDAEEDEEKKIRRTIRQRRRVGTLIKTNEDSEKLVLQEMARITRDEGIRSIVVPFDVIEPDSADRRGTGQFISLIEISAFINQFQRPVLEMKDGSKHILATFDDFRAAAELWFSFHEAQKFKIPAKAILLLKEVPTEEGSCKKCSEIAGRSDVRDGIGPQTTVEHYMETLYDRGLVYREKISAPGSPWGYWTNKQIQEKVKDFGKRGKSERSDAGDLKMDLGIIQKDSILAKYIAENSSDCLKSSIYEFFTNQDLVKRDAIERVLGIDRQSFHQCAIRSYLSQFEKEVLKGDTASQDSEDSRKTDISGNNPDEATTSIDIVSLGDGQIAQKETGCAAM